MLAGSRRQKSRAVALVVALCVVSGGGVRTRRQPVGVDASERDALESLEEAKTAESPAALPGAGGTEFLNVPEDQQLDEAEQAVKEAEELAAQAAGEADGAGAPLNYDAPTTAEITTQPPSPKTTEPQMHPAVHAESHGKHGEHDPHHEDHHVSSQPDSKEPEREGRPQAEVQGGPLAAQKPVKYSDQAKESAVIGDMLRQATMGTKAQMKDVSEMFGDIKRDMYQMNEKIADLQREIQDGVKLEPADPEDSLVYPLSPCLRSILTLTVVYFILYTAVTTHKLLMDVLGIADGGLVEESLRAACDAAFYAPMLCVLFLGAQLRALQITRGERGPQEVAEIAMEACTWSVVVQAGLVFVIAFLTGEAPEVDSDSRVEIPELDSRPLTGLLTLVRFAAMVCLYLSTCVVCAAVVLMDARSLGAEPVDMWDDPLTSQTEYAPPLSAAMACTMTLTFLFFLVYSIHALLRSTVELFGGIPGLVRDGHDASGVRECVMGWEECMKGCTYTVNLVPMLCVLFMAARMRALQIDGQFGRPQWWAESCFYWCTASVVAHVVVMMLSQVAGIEPELSPGMQAALCTRQALGRPPAPRAERRTSTTSSIASIDSRPDSTTADDDEGREKFGFPSESTYEQKAVVMVRMVLLGITYVSCVGVVIGVLTLRAPGGRKTPAIPPSLHCVLLLAGQFFMVYLCLFFSQVAASAVFTFGYLNPRQRREVARSVWMFSLAECTAKLCPMLAVLFIGTRLRAVQMSRQGGSPQCWAQDAMYSASWALLIQLLVVLAVGQLATTITMDTALGTPKSKGLRYMPGKIALEILKILTCVALYGSIVVVGFSIVVIRPETAGCAKRGYFPLASEQALF